MKKEKLAALVLVCGLTVLAVGVSLVATHTAAAYFPGGWPESCLEVNDMVEGSPRGSGAVGIYQRAFGEAAEQACRNDHTQDVRRAFAWAFPEVVPASAAPGPAHTTASPAAVPTPATTASAIPTKVRIHTGLFDQVIDLTLLEFRRGPSAEALLRANSYVYEPPAAGEEYVAARFRIDYLAGQPGDSFLAHFQDFTFIHQSDGLRGGYLYVPEAIELDGLVRRGESRDGWVAAVINEGARVYLQYQHSRVDDLVTFHL